MGGGVVGGGVVGCLVVGGAVGDLRVVGDECGVGDVVGELLHVADVLDAGAEPVVACAGAAECEWAAGLPPEGDVTGRDEDAAGPDEVTDVLCTTAAGCSVWVTFGWPPEPVSTSAAAVPAPISAAAIVLTATATPRRGRRPPG
ncbi:MAG: hypothetical protein WAK82_35620, partial [Streptosporangiaceae bacterium]